MWKTYWIFNNYLSTEHLETIHLLMIHQWPTFPLNPVFSLADRQMLSATYPLGHDIDLFLNFVCAFLKDNFVPDVSFKVFFF